MTPVERQMLSGLFERVGASAATARDAEAEAFINDNIRNQPHAPYVLAQTVLVQQQAVENAMRRVQELEAQVKTQTPQEETSFLGSLGKSLFGGGAAPQQAAPQRPSYDASAYSRPQYSAPPQQPGPWGQQPQGAAGGGFLQSALTTATGVAGGMVLANALGGLFGGHSAGLFGGGSGFGGGGETINNFYESAPDAAGQHAQDVLQDQDQDQDAAQDAQDSGFDSGGDSGGYDT